MYTKEQILSKAVLMVLQTKLSHTEQYKFLLRHGFWLRKENPHIVFLEGFDPGVQFFSFYNRDTKRSLTICLNDEQTKSSEVFEKYFGLVQ